jgi:uncharacterized protein YehS (DUF1456 family)
MRNNDVLRRVRYIFNFSDSKMIALFALGSVETTREVISTWLKKEEDEDFVNCVDAKLSAFLNGLIEDKRGKKEGAKPVAEKRLTNNIVLRKLKIALDLKNDDVLEILTLADFNLGKHELTALFRKAGHKNFRVCKDQVLRNFLMGLQIKHRKPDESSESDETDEKVMPES